MDSFKYARLWRFNTPEQNDLLALRLFLTGNFSTFTEWIEDGMPLNAFMLSELALCHSYGEESLYLTLVLKAKKLHPTVRPWLEEFFTPKLVLELLKKKPELLSDTFPSNEFCIKQEQWDILKSRKVYDVIAQKAPQELENCADNAAIAALVKVNAEKYLDLAFEKKLYNVVVSPADGWKYLIDKGQAEWLFKNNFLMKWELISEQNVLDYCLEKGLVDLLYKYHYYQFLMEHNELDVFVKNRSYASEFLNKYPEYVDWEDLWNSSVCGHNYLIEQAFKHSDVQKCYDFLWKHAGWVGRLRLLTGG